MLVMLVFTLISYNLKAQSPPSFMETFDCSSCLEEESEPTGLPIGCNNTSSYYNSNPFYMISPSSNVKIVRLNFVFLQKNDGSGNFVENDQEHQQIIDDVIDIMNNKMSNMAIAECGGSNSNSKIQFEVNRLYIPDSYLWNNDNDPQTIKCPNRSTWYLRQKALQIDSDPNIPHGIDVFFTNSETVYNYNVVNNNSDYQGAEYACSMFPTSDYSEGSYVHMPDCFIKYYWMKEWATQEYNQPWDPVVYGWYVNTMAQLIVHELGHSLGLSHNLDCIAHNIMNPAGSGCAHDYLNDAQLYTCHRNLSIMNIRKFVKEQTSLDASLIITGNELIDFDTRQYRNIIIEDGGVLTISCKVLMPSIGKIIVKQGGKLIVDEGTITSAQYNLWRGIEVWGDPNEHQFTINGSCAQGILELKSATIENAIVGVRTFDYYNINTTTGGIVIAEDSYFLNNGRSVSMFPYKNIYAGNEIDNISRFTNCSFIIDENYLQNNYPYEGENVMLYGVKAVKFLGCTFVNNKDEEPSGYAINTYNAGFWVEGLCTNNQVSPCQEYQNSVFRNFKKAINAANAANTLYFCRVQNADFYNNGFGIQLSNVNDAVITENNFVLGYVDGCQYPYSKGIYLDNSKRFAVEENQFDLESPPAAIINTGIQINNTNNESDQVYKNRFDNMLFGNFTTGKNWNTDNMYGLAFYCNENMSNEYDFYVDNFVTSDDGIQLYQGSRDFVSGNTFSDAATGHFFNYGAYEIGYY